jgi:branched-chain amino acid transport system permease protein/neutral amino acid transport system permease protein
MSIILPSIGFGLITASIFAIAAVGFTLQFGATNVLNLAYADTMTAAAFVAYLVTQAGLSIWLALIAGTAFGAAFSAALNRFVYVPYIRRGTKLFGMVILTIAVSIIIQFGLMAIYGSDFYSLQNSAGTSYHAGPFVFTATQIAIVVIAVVAMLAIHFTLTYTKLGKAMRATATDPDLARDCGINTDRVIDLVWLLSGALCGLAGVVLVMNVTSFNVTTGSGFLIPILAVAILGGIGQARGAMLGALVIGIASEVAGAVISPGYKTVVAFVILVLVLLVRPQGILSEVATQKELAA